MRASNENLPPSVRSHGTIHTVPAATAIAGLEEEIIYGSNGEGGKVDIGRLKKIRLTGKIPALEGLARHLGMFQDDRGAFAQQFQITIHVGREE